jgi:hypothetical protein
LLNYLAYPQLILFAILLLYKSVGTTTYAWAIPKYIISHDKEACNSFKAYYLYEASLRAKDRLANKDVKIMHFHAEPGIQTSLYMDRGYYWQDEHYHNNRRFMDLYRARNKNELVRLLKKKNIKVFVVTGLNKPTINEWINHDPQTRHLLPQLLLDHDSAFEFDGVFAYLKD